MKRSLYLFGTVLLILVMAMSMTSCGKSKARKNIKNAIENIKLPEKLQDGTKLTEITFDDNVLTMRIEMSKKELKKFDPKTSAQEKLEGLRQGLFPRALVQEVIKAGASMEFIYYNGDQSVTLRFDADQLKGD